MKSLRRLFTAAALPILMGFIIVGCSGPVKTPTKTLTSIAVTPASPAHLKVGATQQFTATGTYSDSSTADITATVTWASGTTAAATITASGGLATGVAAGITQITASMGTVTSPGVTLTVIAVTSIAVTPNPASVAVSGTVQLTATGTYSDASTADISSQVTWACAPSTVATISASGLATAGAANATCQITATLGAIVSPSVTLTVGTGGVPVPVAVKIVQVNPTIAVGGVEDFTAVALLSDGTTAPLGTAATWGSGTTATATIFATNGIASGVAAGTTTITASSGTLTPGTTLLTVVPAVATFAYAPGQNDVAAASYAINASASTLIPTGIVRDTTKPVQILPAPSGQFAYGPGANSPGLVSLYNVDPKTGVLTFSATFNSGIAGLAPIQSIIDKTGRFIYIVNNSSPGSVAALATNTTTFDGSLTQIAGSPFTVGNFPVGIAEDPGGKFAFVTNNGDGTISGFTVGADGSLGSPIAPVTTGSGVTSSPGVPAIDPTGSFLYVPNQGDSTISIFSISGTGTLATVGSPVSTGAGSSPTMIAITANGKFLYVTDAVGNTIVGFTIGAGGTLSGATTGSPYATGTTPQGLAIDVSGGSLVVANGSDNTLTYFAIDSTTGKLTAGQTVETRGVPIFVNLSAGIAAPFIAPATAEAANVGTATPGTGSVSSYTVNPATGAITIAASSPTTTLDGNDQVATSTSGKFFYTASTTGKNLDGFSLDSSAAALAGFTTNPTTLGTTVPGGLYAEPEDKYVYVADKTAATVVAFNTSASSGLTTNSTSASLVSVNAIAGDAQGILMAAMGLNQLETVVIDQGSGAPAPGQVLAQAGTWTAGAIDPSARFLVAADSVGHQISSFAITPVTLSGNVGCLVPPLADGCLTLVSGPVAVGAGLVGPYAVTFDPLGRFVFVADKATGSVAVFTFSTAGVPTASGTPVVVSPQGITNVAVEATGKFLYVGTKGNGTTTAGTVVVYSINSTTGALTATGSTANAGIGTAAVSITNSVN
jgi:6-phosphogluconolactonase (cycloisomerase 2 family)